ncbi:MAG: hypothetical protein ABI477_23660 [Chryseolinea sp.]
MKQKNTHVKRSRLSASKPRWLSFILLLAASSIFGACQKEVDILKPVNDTKFSTAAVKLKYEVETLTVPEWDNADNSEPQVRIMSMAFSTRNKVEVNISEDGASNWRIERMSPKTDVEAEHLSPPGVEPETHLTVIDESGVGRFYDAKGAMLHSNPVPIPSYKEMMANFKTNPNSLFSILGAPSVDNLNQIIEKAKEAGGIQELGNNMVSVRTGKNSSGVARSEGILDNTSKVDIYNKDLGLCLGSTLYDQQNQILCQTFYSYSVTPDQRWFPNRIYMKGWDNDPLTGKMRAQESTTYFENVTINIKNL